jgi:hypothetical protein
MTTLLAPTIFFHFPVLAYLSAGHNSRLSIVARYFGLAKIESSDSEILAENQKFNCNVNRRIYLN